MKRAFAVVYELLKSSFVQVNLTIGAALLLEQTNSSEWSDTNKKLTTPERALFRPQRQSAAEAPAHLGLIVPLAPPLLKDGPAVS